MSPITDTSLFRSRVDILNAMLTALQGAIPDVYVGDDGVVKILYQIESAQLESAFLANQLLLEEVFPQTASQAGLRMHGETYALAFKTGDLAEGVVTFSGEGGTVILKGTQVGAYQGEEFDPVKFATETEVTIPNPGVPTALTATAAAVAGNLSGAYEYQVSFTTAAGETLVGDTSTPVEPTNQQVDLTNIPIGGAGTLYRKIYRRRNGIDPYKLVTVIADNTTTIYTDNIAEGSLTTPPPSVDTAHRVDVDVTAILPGSDGNVVTGGVTLLINAPTGVLSVINEASFFGGEGPETTEQYRQRLLQYIRNPRTGSTTDLKWWAESHNEVEEATVFNNDNLGTPINGHATVRISGPAGEIPDAETISEVQQLLDMKDLANITIHVATFTPVSLNVTVNVTEDAEHTLGEITPSVQQAIADYIYTVPVGGTVYLAGIVDAVYGLDGVQDVVVSSPGSNQTVTATQKFVAGTITVN